ncbi:MAG: Hsp20/alpha crystallin family protein [Thaumarchaeota archaeon]|nr:Hsp20/alpha crystallin family protein [Nitrososphaerota archaeon]
MSSDIDRLFDELASVLDGVLNGSISAGTPRTISAKVSMKVGYLGEILGSARVHAPANEPLIDVIDTGDSYRVIVMLPGVKKDDVSVSRLGGVLRVEVTKENVSYVKTVPCGTAPAKVAVTSAKENNSVVELVFAKRGGRK